MIILFHPRATRPRTAGFRSRCLRSPPFWKAVRNTGLSTAIWRKTRGAMLRLIDMSQVELLGVSCMPGPQMVAAMEACREIRA